MPGSGLTISRVNTYLDGQGNPIGPPDELYLYRPGGTTTSGGDVQSAYFSVESARTEFNDDTNPSCFLSNGGDGGINIIQISSAYEDSISFIFNPQEAFIMGMLNSDNPDADVTEATIQLGNETYEPFAQGDYVITHFQGTYDFEVSLPGHGTFSQEVTLSPENITTLDVDLHYLEVPQNLSYESEGNMVTLDWDYTDINHPDFDHFNICMSLNGVTFNSIATSEETTHTRPLVGDLEYYFYITAEYTNGLSEHSNIIHIESTDSDENEIPVVTSLIGNYPNPFNPTTTISFSLTAEDAKDAKLEIFNIKGQQVKDLTPAVSRVDGQQSVVWDGTDNGNKTVPSGIYFYKLKSNSYQQTKKMILLK